MSATPISDTQYQQQLTEKLAKFTVDFSEFSLPEIRIFESPIQNFRMRAEFRIWHKGEKSSYCMFTNDKFKTPYDIDSFPIGSAIMNDVMPRLMAKIHESEVLRFKLYQVDFLTTLSGQVLTTLIYHKALSAEWEALARTIEAELGIFIIGRSRKQKIVLTQDFVIEQLQVQNSYGNIHTYSYQQLESGFTQPNASVCEKMLSWAVTQSSNWGGDLVELYCGNGNFTLPLSKNFDKVLATELSKPSVNAALYNIELNEITNVKIGRLSAEEFSEAIQGKREFNRLAHVNLAEYNFSSVFVDPPRAGMDPLTTEITQGFDNIMYISCNPETLRENLRELTQTHDITAVAVFDQFPYTHHLEVGMTLRKR